jgi:hypothetical protein
MKNGDIVYTNKKYCWYSYSSNNNYDIISGEAFRIVDIDYNNWGTYVDISNVKLGYSILVGTKVFNNCFNIRQIRRDKLKKLGML